MNEEDEYQADGEYVECWNCAGTGFSYHDCGEDVCCCAYPEDNIRCDICAGNGGWIVGDDEDSCDATDSPNSRVSQTGMSD